MFILTYGSENGSIYGAAEGPELVPGRAVSPAFFPVRHIALQPILPETEQGSYGSHRGTAAEAKKQM